MEDIRASLVNGDNREITLGMIIEKLDTWEKIFAAKFGTHDAQLEEVFKRLDQQEQYLFVFKISKCAFSWLDQNGFVKWALIFFVIMVIDQLNRIIYWEYMSGLLGHLRGP